MHLSAVGLRLSEFMDQVGATQYDVAEATRKIDPAGKGVDQSTISRIERGGEPKGRSLALIQRWADRVAKRRKLPRSKWLTWDHLVSGREDAAA